MSLVVVRCGDVIKFKRFLEAIFFSAVASTHLQQFEFDHVLLCCEDSSYLLVSEKVPQELLKFLPSANNQIILNVTGMSSVLMAVSHQQGIVEDEFTTGETFLLGIFT